MKLLLKMITGPSWVKFALYFLVASLNFNNKATGDLVAHYLMNEGVGNVVFDASGKNNHGTIYNGSWVFGSYGTALYFTGYNDGHINCGNHNTLNIENQGSILVWFKPMSPIQGGLVCWGLGGSWAEQRFTTLLNSYGNYNEFGVYFADGVEFARPYRGPMPPVDQWTCLAVTYTGRSVDIYLNGVLKKTVFQKIKPALKSFDLLIGKAHGWAQHGSFRGLIDEVRIYNHCLSSQEVYGYYKSEAFNRGKDTSGFDTILIHPKVCPKPGTVEANLDYRGLAPSPKGLTIKAEIYKVKKESSISGAPPINPINSPKIRIKPHSPGASQSVGEACAGAVRVLPLWGEARVVFNIQNFAKGDYKIRIRAFDGHKQVGKTATKTIKWPGRDPKWKGISALNNLCWELLNKSPGKNPEPSYDFYNPRQGWVYFCTSATGNLTLSVNGAAPSVIHGPLGAEKQEAMRWLDGGNIQLTVKGAGSLSQLIVRAVPSLVFGHWPNVKTGLINKTDHGFLAKHVLPQSNTIMDHGNQWFTDHWVNSMGGRWRQIVYKKIAEASGSTQGIYDYLTKLDGLCHPNLHAVQVDEFYPSAPYIKEWTDACKAILLDPKYNGRRIIPYFGGNMWDVPDCAALLKTFTDHGSWIAYEAYLPEMETHDRAWFFVNRSLTHTLSSLDQVIPGVVEKLQVVLSYLTEFSGENSEVQADMKAYMDMQFQMLATEPQFFGVQGIEEYVSHHSDEESIRWAARLYRHYALEGKRNLLSEDPYTLSHMLNGDFLQGTDHWTIDPAEPGAIDVKSHRGYGKLQHRRSYGYGTMVPFLCTRRSAVKPNRFSQTITGLETGRLYSLKLITGDYYDLMFGRSIEKVHDVSIQIKGAELLSGPEYGFCHTGTSYGEVGAFNQQNPYWMNLHCQVFKALGSTAEIMISDWENPFKPGGEIGQTLIYNHIEVQPYYMETP